VVEWSRTVRLSFDEDEVGMKKHRALGFFLIVLTGVLSVAAFRSVAFCRLNLPQIEQQTTIEGRDHQVLKDSLLRFEQEKANNSPNDLLKRVLLRALPGVYRMGCREMVDQWGPAAEGTAALSVRVLHVEAGKEENPARALLAYTCSSGAGGQAGPYRDERLGALVIERNSSRLSMMAQDKDCETCPELVRITPEKDVRIGGKGLIGLNFLKSNENPCCGKVDILKEERVYFYLFQDDGVKPAGSVLKGREESVRSGEANPVKTVYRAGVVFKKDMKGNIVGILSPYTVEKNDRRTDKGMIRFNWDGERGEFVTQ
jgi:hypothetical protein